MVKNVPKSKTSVYLIKFYVLHLISLDLNSLLSQTVKKYVLAGEHRMVEYGENVLAGERQFYLLEMLRMKFCSVRN